jgi:voltage-gated potassium channel
MLSSRLSGWRARTYELLEGGAVGHRGGLLVDRLIVTLVIVSLISVALESVPSLAARYEQLFTGIEILALVAFSVEYVLRIWVAVEHPPYRHLRPGAARLKFATSGLGIIDLIAVLPFWLSFVMPSEWQVLVILRVFRFLKLGRYSPAMRSLLDVLYIERRALFGCFVILLGAALLAATLMYVIEGNVQPQKFGTIPEAMWWAIVTLGTIGYGDAVPVTILGRLVASVIIFTGLIMIALPVGIIASSFAEKIHRRDFVVTWSMVARVPLFAELDAAQIAEIMQLLRSQQISAGTVIARRGDPAHSMYFIAAGEVEIDLKGQRVRLGPGQFFGEIAVLLKAQRSANVTAMTFTSLLVLDARDVHLLMDREPRIAQRIRETARSRVGREVVGDEGDLVSEELVPSEPEESLIPPK